MQSATVLLSMPVRILYKHWELYHGGYILIMLRTFGKQCQILMSWCKHT